MVRARLDEAVQLAADELRRWGLPVEKREANDKAAPLTMNALSVDAYESGRPSEEEAPREGDIRFMPRGE